MASRKRGVTCRGCGLANRIRSTPSIRVYGFEQPAEVARRIVGRRVVVHDLAEQLHFSVARVGGLTDLRHDIRLRPHALVSPRVRDDAEAAELVAPFDDRHIRLDRIGTPRHAKRGT